MSSSRSAKPTALFLTTGFPRFVPDVYAPFVWQYAVGLSSLFEEIIVCAPSSGDLREKKNERIGNIEIHRFQYFYPRSLQRLCYGSGIPDNLKRSFLAWVQIPFFGWAASFSSLRYGRSAQVVYCHWLPTLIPAFLLKLFFKARLIAVLHGSDLRILPRWITRTLLQLADEIITGHEELQERVLQWVPTAQPQLIRNFIDTEKFAVRSEKRKKQVLFIGRLVATKDPLFFVEVASRLTDEFPDTEFILVGDGALRGEVDEKIQEIGSSRIKALGARTDVHQWVAESGLCFFSDTIDNLWSMTVVESLFSGTPCVLNDAGDTRKVFRHGENCILYSQGNVESAVEILRKALQGEFELDQIALKAREVLEHGGFTEEAIVAKHREKIRELLG